MPLKLLAKKSWHVYNADNIARVRRDEAEARAREEDEERQQRAAESSQRAALLRGESFSDRGDESAEQSKWATAERATRQEQTETAPSALVASSRTSTRRPRKRHGEDDTDFEMRMARAQVEEEEGGVIAKRQKTGAAETDRPLFDRNGNFDLFGQLQAEALAHRSQKSRSADPVPDVPPSSMRFADAAGGPNALSAWYAGEKGPTPASKPSFSSASFDPSNSNNKPRRPPISAPAGSMAADPLAAMRQGAAAVRALKQERQRENDERRRDMAALVAEQEEQQSRERERHRHHIRREHRETDRHREHREHRDRHDSRRRRDEENKDEVDSLDGFTLDGDTKETKRRDSRGGKERRHRSHRDRRDERDSRDDTHSDRGHRHDWERRHHHNDRDGDRDKDGGRSHRHHRDRDNRGRSHRERPRNRDRSLSPKARISA